MGVRDVAAAAKVADDAAKEAEKKRCLRWNLAKAEETVQRQLGLPGKAIRGYTDKEHGGGEGSVVDIGDGLFIRVCAEQTYGDTDWMGHRHPTGEKYHFKFCTPTGVDVTKWRDKGIKTFSNGKQSRQIESWSSFSWKFADLPTMSVALEEMDTYPLDERPV